jgi:valyl-tRNA synthetase
MQGRNTLWLPGFDHAGLATWDKIKAEMLNKNLDPNDETSRQEFTKEYICETRKTISHQLRRTGASCDWSRSRFTLDEQYSDSVQTAFDRCRHLLYRDGDNWYLDMSTAAKNILGELEQGNIEIIPHHAEKTLRHFLENIEPWCISRQIPFGHQMPIEGATAILDTWFSSSLWTFASLGWPENTNDFSTFYPAAIIETADDILFFWCARMLMMGHILTDKLPFGKIYLHGILRDKNGDKMSKSLGNGMDPLEIIDKYGCDAMRFALIEGSTPGQDSQLHDEKFESAKSLRTKLWNAAKFSLPHFTLTGEITHENDIKMMARLEQFRLECQKNISNCDFHLYASALRKFLYNDFSSHYIETSRERLYGGDESAKKTISLCLDGMLKAFHPMMPFITEEIFYQYSSEMLITSAW